MRFFCIAAICLCVGLQLSACTTGYSWNQKLTVEVNTPAGVKTGASVVGIKVTSGQLGLSQTAAAYRVTGEATVVEVAPGKYLFALLGERSTNELATHTWADQLPRNADEAWTKIEALREKRDVPRAEYPLLVTFSDLNDPKSVKEVKPDRLADVFGAGFALKAVTLEITDEAVTGGKCDSVLNWLNEFYDTRLDGSTIGTLESKYRLANDLASGNFDTEK
jgi:hypothetical protein